MFCNFAFAKNFTYHCNLNTQFINKNDKYWKNKNMKFSFNSIDNKTISIFDHEIEITYQSKLDILKNHFCTLEKNLQ